MKTWRLRFAAEGAEMQATGSAGLEAGSRWIGYCRANDRYGQFPSYWMTEIPYGIRLAPKWSNGSVRLINSRLAALAAPPTVNRSV